ncbi:PilZ domain-containing protein [Altererythrobacter sp. BO-6]|uniref:PilZ domain-containing protein n=1 Tax=Altererythrobacter sp. BO-6 TaxID=2604537 RepID=UPI0013E1DB02|nr:PilZ domain-containing protein [Altererythrobacter sp. BO-6]QIG52955.1 PilZ domain-containing protein [Altererythrobacter sp. BO-6]
MSARFEREDEQRLRPRTVTVYKPVLVETAEVAAFCLLRDISPSGMMARTYVEYAEGSAIKVTFGCDLSVEGKVVWSRDARVGIEFDKSIDVPLLLQQLSIGLPSGLKRRSPRLQIRTFAYLSLTGRRMPVELIDISQNGVKVNAPYLQPEDEVTIELSGMSMKRATVRWTHTGFAGLKFQVPLDFNQLAEWVIEQQIRKDNDTAPSPQQTKQRANRI